MGTMMVTLLVLAVMYALLRQRAQRCNELIIERDKALEEAFAIKRQMDDFRLREDNVRRREEEIRIFLNIIAEIRCFDQGSRLDKTFSLVRDLLHLDLIKLYRLDNNELSVVCAFPVLMNQNPERIEITAAGAEDLAVIFTLKHRKIYYTGEPGSSGGPAMNRDHYPSTTDRKLAVASLPLACRDQVIGVLELIRPQPFTRSEISTAIAISESVGILLYINSVPTGE